MKIIFAGTPNVGNVVQGRDHDAELALSGPSEGARDPEAKSQIMAVASISGIAEFTAMRITAAAEWQCSDLTGKAE